MVQSSEPVRRERLESDAYQAPTSKLVPVDAVLQPVFGVHPPRCADKVAPATPSLPGVELSVPRDALARRKCQA